MGDWDMKQGKKLNRKHKEFLSKLDLNPSNYILERQDGKVYSFINVSTKKLEKFNLDGSRC